MLMLSLVRAVYGLTGKDVTFLWTVNAVVWSLAHTILRFGLDKAFHPLDKTDRVPPLVDLIFLSW